MQLFKYKRHHTCSIKELICYRNRFLVLVSSHVILATQIKEPTGHLILQTHAIHQDLNCRHSREKPVHFDQVFVKVNSVISDHLMHAIASVRPDMNQA